MRTLDLVPAGAGVWVFRYGGHVLLWLGCQDPLAGLWGIPRLRHVVQDQCVCVGVGRGGLVGTGKRDPVAGMWNAVPSG